MGTRKKPIALPSIYDAEAREERMDRFILQMLAQLEEDEIRLDAVQLVNSHHGNDVVPGEPHTYDVARERIAASRQQIADTCDQPRLDRIAELAKKL